MRAAKRAPVDRDRPAGVVDRLSQWLSEQRRLHPGLRSPLRTQSIELSQYQDGRLMAQAARDGRTSVQVAIDAVNSHIREENLPVGDRLPGKGWFAERVGVSRAVMREAFGALAALRLVDVAKGRKPRVGALDGSVIATSLDHGISTAQVRVTDVWKVRRTIELRTAALAASNAAPDESRRIVELAEALALEDESGEATTETDIAFHLAIAEASGNTLFYRVAVLSAWRTRHTAEERSDVLTTHRRLASSIEHWGTTYEHA